MTPSPNLLIFVIIIIMRNDKIVKADYYINTLNY